MYVTIKQSQIKQSPIKRETDIDKLFNSDIYDTVLKCIRLPKDSDIIRYKTFETDTPNEHIKPERLRTALEFIHRKCQEHPNPEEEYIHFKIPKKTHGYRQIDAPTDELKQDLRKIADMLSNFLDICTHDSAWAYVKGRSVVSAMAEHVENKSRWYLKLDLHNFFGSCTREFTVNSLLQLYPFATNKELCEPVLNELFTLASLDGKLPQGTPLSPMLTNLIMVAFDHNLVNTLSRLGRNGELPKQRYIYTRYADDIIISAQTMFDYRIIIKAINELLKDTPLSINQEKTRYGNYSGRNWNLGVMCNKDYKISIGHEKKKYIRVNVHNYIKDLRAGNEWELPQLQKLLGHLSWLKNVDEDAFYELLKYFNEKYERDVYNTLIEDIKSKQRLGF